MPPFVSTFRQLLVTRSETLRIVSSPYADCKYIRGTLLIDVDSGSILRVEKKYSFVVFGEKYNNLDEMERELEIFGLGTKEIKII